MKRLLSYICSFLLLITVAIGSVHAIPPGVARMFGISLGPEMFDQETLDTELITNGGMEAGADPDNWSTEGSPIISERSNEQANSGTYSNKIGVNAQFEGTRQAISIVAGSIYKVTVAIYGDGTNKFACTAYEIASATHHFSPLSVSNVGYVYPASGTIETWYFIAGSTAINCNLYLYSATGVVTGTYYLDDVSIAEVTAPDKSIPENDPWPALAGADVNTEEDASSPLGVTEANDVSLWNNSGFDTFASEADPHMGTYSAHFVAGDTADSAATNEITVSDNALYRVSFFYKLAANDAQTYAKYSIGETGTLEKYVAFTNLTATAFTEVVSYVYTDGTDLVITVANGGTDADVDINVDAVSVRLVQFSWTPIGTNTIEIDETEDAVLVTCVNNGNGARLYFKDASDLSKDLTIGRAYTCTVDLKVGVGDTLIAQIHAAAFIEQTGNIAESWTTYTFNWVATTVSADYFIFASMGVGDVVYIRELSIKQGTTIE